MMRLSSSGDKGQNVDDDEDDESSCSTGKLRTRMLCFIATRLLLAILILYIFVVRLNL